MFWSQDQATLYLCFRQSGKHAGEIKDEITAAMGNDSKVGVLSLCYVLREFQLQTVVVLLWLVHDLYIYNIMCNLSKTMGITVGTSQPAHE